MCMLDTTQQLYPVSVPPGMVTSEQVQDAVNTHRTAAGHGRLQITSGYMLCPVNIQWFL